MKIRTKFWVLFSVALISFLWANSSFATVGKPMIAYSENETASIQYNQYSSSTWATGATAASTSRKQFWKVAKTGPYSNRGHRASPAPISTSRVQTQYLNLNLPMRFEANQGQTDPQVNFISRGSGYTLFLTPTEAVMVLRKGERPPLAGPRICPSGLEDRFRLRI